jgi:hypothetical protein
VPGPHALDFSFNTKYGIDGVNFRIARGTDVRLRLAIDGPPIGVDRIFVGGYDLHPGSNPFTVPG